MRVRWNQIRYRILRALMERTEVGRALLFNEWLKGWQCAYTLWAQSFPTENAVSGENGGGGNRTRVTSPAESPSEQGDHPRPLGDPVVSSVPTERQYEFLLVLGSGSAGLSIGKRKAEPLIRRGWVTGEWRPPYYQFVRITPDGLRALALAVERFGLPDLGPKPKTAVRVCSDCGSERYRTRMVEVPV